MIDCVVIVVVGDMMLVDNVVVFEKMGLLCMMLYLVGIVLVFGVVGVVVECMLCDGCLLCV